MYHSRIYRIRTTHARLKIGAAIVYETSKRLARGALVRVLVRIPGAGWPLIGLSLDARTIVYGVRMVDGEWLAAFEATSPDDAIAQCCQYAGFTSVADARAQGYELTAEKL